MKICLLIDMKMPTIVGISYSLAENNTYTAELIKKKSFIASRPDVDIMGKKNNTVTIFLKTIKYVSKKMNVLSLQAASKRKYSCFNDYL